RVTQWLSIMISSLMLLTQKITSLALDIHERKVTVITLQTGNGIHRQIAVNVLVVLSYFLFFPALLGGPLCSFVKFQQHVHRSHMSHALRPTWLLIKGCAISFLLQMFRSLVAENIDIHGGLLDCTNLNCIYIMWITAVLFKLTYYSHWMLDESLLHATGFVNECLDGSDLHIVSDLDIWALETTHKISFFARSWNKSTAIWMKRLVFTRCKTRPLLMTFAFSAWWHGLYPGQVVGFLCWAMMVEADYRIHKYLGACEKVQYIRYLYKIGSWFLTQLIIAFIMVAVEMRSFAMVWALCSSYNSGFPMLQSLFLITFSKKKRTTKHSNVSK
ncbi:Hypothetical predicted protein, partial [Pelobates cultripes]